MSAEQIEQIKKYELDILNQKSQALKQYITDNVQPSLTLGLIKICNEQPEDPLNFLVYLFNYKTHSYFFQADFLILHGTPK